MRLKISHTTTYDFDTPTGYGLQQVRLTPKSRAGQTIVDWSMTIDGGRTEVIFADHHANMVNLIALDPEALSVTVTSSGEVETEDQGGVIGKHGGFAPLWLFLRSTPLTRAGANVRRIAKGLREEVDDDIPRLHALSSRILTEVPYKIGETHPLTTADEAIDQKAGVCQDHAHIFVAAARSLGYPARYVSGYLMMQDRVDQDATHAWAEAHVDGIGWVGFDVSNGISPDARYVRVATGLDYTEVAPVSGLHFGPAQERLAVDIQVQQQ